MEQLQLKKVALVQNVLTGQLRKKISKLSIWTHARALLNYLVILLYRGRSHNPSVRAEIIGISILGTENTKVAAEYLMSLFIQSLSMTVSRSHAMINTIFSHLINFMFKLSTSPHNWYEVEIFLTCNLTSLIYLRLWLLHHYRISTSSIYLPILVVCEHSPAYWLIITNCENIFIFTS